MIMGYDKMNDKDKGLTARFAVGEYGVIDDEAKLERIAMVEGRCHLPMAWCPLVVRVLEVRDCERCVFYRVRVVRDPSYKGVADDIETWVEDVFMLRPDEFSAKWDLRHEIALSVVEVCRKNIDKK